jgi:hypothetical protein
LPPILVRLLVRLFGRKRGRLRRKEKWPRR